MAQAYLPNACDYLIVGGGATGFAFADTVLHHSSSSLQIVIVDAHEAPGGHWNDSYDFVELHQPSKLYGVETVALGDGSDEHRANRKELLEYYDKVREKWTGRLHFCGGVYFDLKQELNKNSDNKIVTNIKGKEIQVGKLVDARFLQPDLPVLVQPKFQVASNIHCVPVNSLVAVTASTNDNKPRHYVVIGGGKTGMDAVIYLLNQAQVAPSDIVWVVPHQAWITARETIGNCMEFLHTCTTLSQAKTQSQTESSETFFQKGFLQWEQQGKVYRLDTDTLPTKFKDATLSKFELETLRTIQQVYQQGRIQKIHDTGVLEFDNGVTASLPWIEENGDAASNIQHTCFVHCTAGAFNHSHQYAEGTCRPPIFAPDKIIIQDVYGTPGFCFVGAVIGRLETLQHVSDDTKNQACQKPAAAATAPGLLGPSGGDIATVPTADHGWVQRLANLKAWLEIPEMREWLVGHRLFNLGHTSAQEMDTLVQETWQGLEKQGVFSAGD